MRILSFFGFIFTVLFLGALGHDIWYSLSQDPLTMDSLGTTGRFRTSDLGWLWFTYAQKSHDWVHQHTDPAFWEVFVHPLLDKSALWVFGICSSGLYIMNTLLRLMTPTKAKSSRHAPGERLRYKRK